MTATTIKVSAELRDRLKAAAAADGVTLGALLDRLERADARARRFAAMRAAIAATSPDDMASYRAETAEWERASLTDLAG